MKLLLTGSLGFTGRRALRQALERGWQLRCPVRRPELIPPDLRSKADWPVGDLRDAGFLAACLAGQEAAIHTVSLGFGLAAPLVQAHQRSGIRRAVFFSTTAIFTTLNAPSLRIRLEAEKAIQSSRLDWTILRPTMIYGSAGDRNIEHLLRWLRRFPIFPVFGSGEHLMQPVHVEDAARAALDTLAVPSTVHKAYAIAGANALTYNELIRAAGRALGKKAWILHLPSSPAITMLKAAEKTGLRLPIRAEQVQRLAEDKAFDITPARTDFTYTPRDFASGVRDEAGSL